MKLARQPAFYRPIKNPKEVCGRLTEGIREALPEILSTKTSKNGLRAIIKQRQECPSLHYSIFPKPESIESAQQTLRFRVTGLHTIVKAAEQLICLTFEDPNEILSEEKREIAKLLQDCYNKKRYTYVLADYIIRRRTLHPDRYRWYRSARKQLK